jgi:hypothetical protein
MTNHWIDLQNCKTILVEGSNVAENHPMAFKWIRKAQENGAKIIHVDPRFTRTSAAADMYARIRPGTDAAFQNAMINHILINKLYDEDYVVTHTNALFLGDEAFDFKDGVFSGFDAENHKYHTETWGYQLDARGKPRVAKSLDDPHCVFSRLKTFASRYTLETGEQITGIPSAQIQQIISRSTLRIPERGPRRRRPASSMWSGPAARPREGTGLRGDAHDARRSHGSDQGDTDRARGRGDRAGGRIGLPEPGDTQREDIHAHCVPRDGKPAKAGRRGIRFRDAAVSPLPGAGLRLRLSDDSALPAGRRSGVVRSTACRLPGTLGSRCSW